MIGYVRAAVVRFLVLLLLWWILAEGDTRFWHYGLVATAVATVVSLRAIPPARPRTGRRPWEIPALGGWFLLALLRGGVDVARRALDPRLPISPHTRRLPILSETPAGRRLALWIINLTPGTLVVDEGEDWVELHVLAEDIDAQQAWAGLEQRLRRIIGT